MASSILGIAKKLRSLTANTGLVNLRRSLSTESSEGTRTTTSKSNLYARIVPLGQPSTSMVPVLDQWTQEGHEISCQQLRLIIQSLRKYRRYTHALEVAEWMSNKGLGPLSSSDHAACLDLIGKVRGLESAERYFDGLSGVEGDGRVYGALLNCYVRESLVEKSLSHMRKMKDLGFANVFCYNDIICLYKNTGQLDKIPGVLAEMKKDGFAPNNVTYRLCINAYGTMSDLDGVEMILKEMEAQPDIIHEWGTYAEAANFYIKAFDRRKSMTYLKKCEALVGKDWLGYNYLISHYANLGQMDEVMRLWDLQKTNCKTRVNRDYITMLGSVAKLGALEVGEEILEEWGSSCSVYDFRVPNVLLIGYCQKGLTEKAESMLRKIVAKGKTPTPNSWAIIASGYLDEKKAEKAYECLKKAIAVRNENVEWRPKTGLIIEILDWLVESAYVKEVEAYVSLVLNAVSGDREMYRALIGVYVKTGKRVGGVLESMKSDGSGLKLNKEPPKTLSSMLKKLL